MTWSASRSDSHHEAPALDRVRRDGHDGSGTSRRRAGQSHGVRARVPGSDRWQRGAADAVRGVVRRRDPRLPPHRGAAGTSDTDAAFDLYERAGGVTTHLSVGPAGGNAGVVPSLGGTSEDGRRVFIDTPEKLVPEDTDDCVPEVPEENPCADVYEVSGGVMTLISTGPGGHGGFGALFAGASADGTRVFFTTSEQLAASDTDMELDIYEREGGSTTLLSTGPPAATGHSSTPSAERRRMGRASTSRRRSSSRHRTPTRRRTCTSAPAAPRRFCRAVRRGELGRRRDLRRGVARRHKGVHRHDRAAHGRGHRLLVGHLRAPGRRHDTRLPRAGGRQRVRRRQLQGRVRRRQPRAFRVRRGAGFIGHGRCCRRLRALGRRDDDPLDRACRRERERGRAVPGRLGRRLTSRAPHLRVPGRRGHRRPGRPI